MAISNTPTAWASLLVALLIAHLVPCGITVDTIWKCQCSGMTLIFPPTAAPGSIKKFSEASAICNNAGYSLPTPRVDIQCLRDYLRHIISSYVTGYPGVWVVDPSLPGCHVMNVDQTTRAIDCNADLWLMCAFRQSSPIAAPNITNASPILPVFSHTAPATKVTYSCDPGYQMAVPGAQLVSECTGTSSWTHPAARCVVKRCPVITVTTELRVSYSHGQDYQSVAVLSCNTGYATQGTTQLMCLSSGSWSHTPAVCVVKRCPMITVTSQLLVSYSHGQDYQSVAVLSCNTGYVTQGTTQLTCSSSGSWSHTPAVCVAVDCGTPPASPNSSPSYNSTILGSEVFYRCQVGYSLSSNNVAVATCNTTGQWSTAIVECSAVDCGPPPTFPNSTTVQDFSSTVFGSNVTYTCTTGHFLASPGANLAVCSDSGLWSTVSVNCSVFPTNTCGSVDSAASPWIQETASLATIATGGVVLLGLLVALLLLGKYGQRAKHGPRMQKPTAALGSPTNASEFTFRIYPGSSEPNATSKSRNDRECYEDPLDDSVAFVPLTLRSEMSHLDEGQYEVAPPEWDEAEGSGTANSHAFSVPVQGDGMPLLNTGSGAIQDPSAVPSNSRLSRTSLPAINVQSTAENILRPSQSIGAMAMPSPSPSSRAAGCSPQSSRPPMPLPSQHSIDSQSSIGQQLPTLTSLNIPGSPLSGLYEHQHGPPLPAMLRPAEHGTVQSASLNRLSSTSSGAGTNFPQGRPGQDFRTVVYPNKSVSAADGEELDEQQYSEAALQKPFTVFGKERLDDKHPAAEANLFEDPDIYAQVY